MADSVHSRYVSYINQTSTQRDSTKTDYTYARSYSYRRKMNDGLMYEWSVPNMCRKSIAYLSTAIRTFNSLKELSEVDANKFLTFVAKGFRKTEKSMDYVNDNQTNDKILQSSQWKGVKNTPSNGFNKLLSTYCLLLLLVVFGSFVCFSYTFGPLITSVLKTQSQKEINYLVEQLEAIKQDLIAFKDSNNELRIMLATDLFSRVDDIDSKLKYLVLNLHEDPNHCLGEENDSTLYVVGCSINKPDPNPKPGLLQLVSSLSNKEKNSYTNLYKFSVNAKNKET